MLKLLVVRPIIVDFDLNCDSGTDSDFNSDFGIDSGIDFGPDWALEDVLIGSTLKINVQFLISIGIDYGSGLIRREGKTMSESRWLMAAYKLTFNEINSTVIYAWMRCNGEQHRHIHTALCWLNQLLYCTVVHITESKL